MLFRGSMLGLSAGRTGCRTSYLHRSWPPHPTHTVGPAPSLRATLHTQMHNYNAPNSIRAAAAASGLSQGEAGRGGQMDSHPASVAHVDAVTTAADTSSHHAQSPQKAQQATAKHTASQQRKRQQRQDRLADSAGPTFAPVTSAPDPAYRYPLPLTTLEVRTADSPLSCMHFRFLHIIAANQSPPLLSSCMQAQSDSKRARVPGSWLCDTVAVSCTFFPITHPPSLPDIPPHRTHTPSVPRPRCVCPPARSSWVRW